MIKQIESPLGRRIALSVLGVAFVIGTTTLIAYNALMPTQDVMLSAGQVAPADIIAPRSITYDSEVLTRLARQAASDAIPEVYDPPNPSVARQQIQLARRVLDYIDNVRNDTLSTSTQRILDLQAVDSLNLNVDTAGKLLMLPDVTWKDLDAQVMGLLERTMRGEIRSQSLEAVYATLPNLVSVAADESEAALITTIVHQLIKPNTFYNEERTREARQQASTAIATERRSFAQGEVVVRAGTIVTESDMEALTQLKLLQPTDRRMQAIVGAFISVLLLSIIGAIYLRRLHPNLFHDVPRMVLLGLLLIGFLAGERIFNNGNDFQSHLYPAAAFSLILVSLTGLEAAVVLTGALASFTGIMNSNSLEYAILIGVGGIAGVLTMTRTERLNGYFRAGLVIGVVNVAVSLFFVLFQGNVDPFRAFTIIIAGLINGVISAGVAVAGLYIISGLLNMPTSLRLIELSQPNQPLLQRLLREAPGTYQHSLQVANLAELAAERIGANALLVRVAALYHDVGKVKYPHFFVENQVEGSNPHDALNDPYRSAEVIINHVPEGKILAHKYRLPEVFVDCIMQHHGTTQVLYFYNKALKAVNCDTTLIDKSKFSYPGPVPQSREAAILMLADSSESIIRAKRPQTKQEIEDIVNHIIEARREEGQLDESYLTVNDLKTIREIFVTTLQGVFHPRIAYPPTPTPEVTAGGTLQLLQPTPVDALPPRATQEIAP